MLNRFISEYLDFTKKQRNGTIVLLLIILTLIILPFFFPFFIHEKVYDHTTFEKQIAALKISHPDSSRKHQYNNDFENERRSYFVPSPRNRSNAQEARGEAFYFDPNTIDEAGWRKLGVKEKTIGTIKNYLAKGGKFYKPADIEKIWGFSKHEVERLVPFVKIEQQPNVKFNSNKADKPTYERKTFTPSLIDINSADTSAFIALPGIGSKLSQRIIGFREKLGGFYKIEQVAETFGLPDSTFQKIKARLILSDAQVKPININTATIDELKSHPYIRFTFANAIVQYRSQHGGFSTVPDLKKIILITDNVYNKLLPYLRL
jgi:competence protein ComEA